MAQDVVSGAKAKVSRGVFTLPPRRAYRMGMPSFVEHRWSPAEVEALPDDGNRYECIDGTLVVTPAPTPMHQDVLRRLYNALGPYVDEQPVGQLYWSPADVRLDGDTLVQPDLFVCVPRVPMQRIRQWSDIGGLRLAIEVLSPSTAKWGRGLKRVFFQRASAEEYWIVDPDARLVERWRPADQRPEIVRDVLRWSPWQALAPLEIDLPALFTAALGDD